MFQYTFLRNAIVLFSAVAFFSLSAAPDYNASFRQINTNMSALRSTSNNHENELRQIEEKFSNLDAIVDGLRQQMLEYSKNQNEQHQTSRISVESKIGELELISKGLAADVQLIKDHVNECVTIISDYKQRLYASENLTKVQGQNIENLQKAIKSIMEILQPSEEKEITQNIYQVKSGDTLEKIAQTQGTTIKTIKELNNLTTDRIRINQRLKIPAK